MKQFYTNPDNEPLQHSLPDGEVFRIDGDRDYHGEVIEPGYYYWICLPGCMPDSESIGPFDTEWEAIAAAQNAGGWYF